MYGIGLVYKIRLVNFDRDLRMIWGLLTIILVNIWLKTEYGFMD